MTFTGHSMWHVQVDKQDMARIQKNLDPALFEKEARALSRDLAMRVKRRAKQIAPKKTGALRRSIDIVSAQRSGGVVSTGYLVGATVPYAKFVHDGTRFMQARPFFKWALEDVNRDAQDAVRGTARRIEKRWAGSLEPTMPPFGG